MTFMKTACFNENVWNTGNYEYDDAVDEDYIVFALWDITDEKYPKLLLCDDNNHTEIEDKIDAFISGVKYNVDITYYHRNILLCEDEYSPVFDKNKLIRFDA